MNSPHSLLQSLLPEIQRNPQLLGILAQSMGGGGQDVGGILGGQPPQALAGGPPMRQAPQPMPQARPAPMTASAPRMGGPQYGGPRASGWRDMARLVAAGIGEARGGNDLAMLRDEWTKRDQGQQQQAQMAALQEQLAGLPGMTPELEMLGRLNPEALLTMRAKPKERERQMVGPDLYERGDDGKWTLVIDGPDKPESVPAGMMIGPNNELMWRPNYLEAQRELAGATSGARRDAVVSRPMPPRARAGGSKPAASGPAAGGGVSYSDIPAGGVVVR